MSSMTRFLVAGLLCALLIAVPAKGSAASPAASVVVTVSQDCTASGELCGNVWSTQVLIQAPASLQVEFLQPQGCSSIRVQVLLDGTESSISRWLGWSGATGEFAALPLDTGVLDLGTVAQGTHVIGLEAEGQVGGCNGGRLSQWGRFLTILIHPTVPTTPRSLAVALPGPNTLLTGPVLPFRWKPFPNAAYYDLQMWLVSPLQPRTLTKSSVTIFSARLTGTGYKITVKAMPKGVYHWRMAAADAAGALISPWTKEQSVTIS